jgi:hypothetical protein
LYQEELVPIVDTCRSLVLTPYLLLSTFSPFCVLKQPAMLSCFFPHNRELHNWVKVSTRSLRAIRTSWSALRFGTGLVCSDRNDETSFFTFLGIN